MNQPSQSALSSEAREPASDNARPAASFKGSGGLQVAIWKNRSEQGFDNYSIRIERTYKEGQEGPFKTTSYFRDSDLLRVSKLIEQADAWIEAEKSKQRATSAARGA